MEEKELFEDYEHKVWQWTPRLYKIFGVAVVGQGRLAFGLGPFHQRLALALVVHEGHGKAAGGLHAVDLGHDDLACAGIARELGVQRGPFI